MKISKSKQELSRIISENGGWRDESEFAAQDGDGTGSIDFFKSTPRYDKDDKYWKGEYDVCERISQSGFTIKDFHQTILSRAEYFHLYPAQDADGWIEWNGVECPVGEGDRIDVKFSDGDEFFDVGSDWDWGVDAGSCNIIAYRLHKQEKKSISSDGVNLILVVDGEEHEVGQGVEVKEPDAKPEFCDSVMRSIPDPTAKPTIEQLAADYRNAKDYAERKQQEADAAKADAEAKLAELVAAGKAIGLVLSVEHEVSVITPALPQLIAGYWRSWRQWEVGDLISWSIVGHIGEFRIISVHHDPSRNIGDFEVEDKHGGVYRAYGNECRFIRRP